jgi:branched-subunit amino acid aminotransferase/4-amino-4-deoxychorismate lyase
MALTKTDKIWHNGKMIAWDDARIHVLSHVVNYASAVFEGIRCYSTPQGPAIFRLREHMQRLIDSGTIYRMEIPFTLDEICHAAGELVRVNKMESCYVRPIVMRGYGDVGRESVELSDRSLHGVLGLGPISWRRSAAEWRGCGRQFVAAARAEYAAANGEGCGQLHEFRADSHGGAGERLRRGHRA